MTGKGGENVTDKKEREKKMNGEKGE